MTLQEFETLATIRYMSQAMMQFLDVRLEDCPNQFAIRWLNSVCSPGCLRLATTMEVPSNSVRRWNHKKMYQKNHVTWECDVGGYILPSLKVMYVCIGARRIIHDPSMFLPDKFLFGDFSLDSLGAILDPDNVDISAVKDQNGDNLQFELDFPIDSNEFDFF